MVKSLTFLTVSKYGQILLNFIKDVNLIGTVTYLVSYTANETD